MFKNYNPDYKFIPHSALLHSSAYLLISENKPYSTNTYLDKLFCLNLKFPPKYMKINKGETSSKLHEK